MRIGYVLHNVKSLRTRLCAGIAADAGINFGIKLHHDLFGGLDLFDIVHLLDKREERQGCDIHIILYLRLARKTHLKLAVSLDSVNSSACAAKAVAAAAAAYKLISGIFHRAHNGEIGGHFIFLAIEVNIYHVFHIYSSPYGNRLKRQ